MESDDRAVTGPIGDLPSGDASADAGRPVARTLLVVLVVGLLVRLALWVWFTDLLPRTFDELDFDAIAQNLVERGEYAIKPGVRTSMRPPLYPATVALVYTAFGVKNYPAVRLLQIVLSLLTVPVVYALGTRVFGKRVGLLASGFTCFYPSLLGHNFLLLTETLFTLLLSLAALALIRALEYGRASTFALAGVLVGLASLTRSVLYPAALPIAVAILCARWLPWNRRLVGAAAFAFAFAATLAPWAIRNTRLEGTFTLIDTNGGRILKWSIGAVIPPTKVATKDTPSKSPISQGEMDRKALTESVGALRHHPQAAAAHVLNNAQMFWGLDRELVGGASEGHFGPLPRPTILLLAVVLCGYYAALMLTAAFGWLQPPAANRMAKLVLLGAIGHVWLVHAAVYGHSRYHITIVPFVAVFSANALLHWRRLADPGRRWTFAVGLAGAAALIASWLWHFLASDYQTVLEKMGLG